MSEGEQQRTDFLTSFGARVRERFQSSLDGVFWTHFHDFALDILGAADSLEVAGVLLGAILQRVISYEFQLWICHSLVL